MARSHARLLLTVWSDPDWRALPMAAQWLYEALISQPDINHAGVLTLAKRRWSQLAADVNRHTVEAALKTLAAARFVVVDDDTEEVLVRSFIRNDNVHRQPNTLKSALRSAQAVQSAVIRAALAAELRRLDVAKVSAMRVPDKHEPIGALFVATLALLSPGSDEPPPDHPRATPSDGYGVGNVEPYGVPKGVPPGEGEGVRSSVPVEQNASSLGRPNQLASPPRTHTREAIQLVRAYATTCPQRPPRKILDRLAAEVDELLAERWPAADLTRALDAWGSKALGPGAFASVAHEVVNRRPSAHAPSTTDQRVAAALSLADRWPTDQPAPLRALPGGAS